MILGDLKTWLAARAGVAALAADRIYPQRAKQGAGFPRILLQRLSSTPQPTIEDDAGVADTTIEVACWAMDPLGYKAAHDMAEAVRDAIAGYRGEWEDTQVLDCRLERMNDVVAQPADGSDNWVHGVISDYRVVHRQSVPTHD